MNANDADGSNRRMWRRARRKERADRQPRGRCEPARRRSPVVEAATDEQYTRNLAARTPIADVNVIVVDARQGISAATRRHGFFAGLLAVRQVVLAVEQDGSRHRAARPFARIDDEFRKLAAQLGLPSVTCVPISARERRQRPRALRRDALVRGPDAGRAARHGRARATRLRDAAAAPAGRMGEPPAASSGGFAGHDRRRPRAQPATPCASSRPGGSSRVDAHRATGGDLTEAAAGEAVTVALDDDGRRRRRGDLIVAADAPAEIANQFEATMVWLADAPLLRGRGYVLRMGTATGRRRRSTRSSTRSTSSTLDRLAGDARWA